MLAWLECNRGFSSCGPSLEEARALPWGLRVAKEHGLWNLESGGHYLPLIQKLQKEVSEDNFLGVISL